MPKNIKQLTDRLPKSNYGNEVRRSKQPVEQQKKRKNSIGNIEGIQRRIQAITRQLESMATREQTSLDRLQRVDERPTKELKERRDQLSGLR